MSRARKYRAPYTRKPDPALLAANALWDEARRVDRRLDAEWAAMRAEIEDRLDDEYEFGGVVVNGGWTISRGDGDTVDVIPTTERGEGGPRTQMLNGAYSTREAALESALGSAVAELEVARSRVRKLRVKIWRARKRKQP